MHRFGKYLSSTLTLIVVASYVIWSIIFIWRSSMKMADGVLFFSLFDDAMISMRYAENFVSGHGLVWNPGEWVEGYTNPLMVILMSLALFLFEKNLAILAIQVLGVVLYLSVAVISVRIYRILEKHRFSKAFTFPTPILLTFFLCIYTLAFWSMMGMETSLVALFLVIAVFIAIRPESSNQRKQKLGLLLLACCTIGLYFSRPDAIAFGIVIIGWYWNFRCEKEIRILLLPVGIIALVLCVHLSVRYAFYGQLVPNTATLKLGSFPIFYRVYGGIGFILPFCESIFPLVLLATVAIVNRWESRQALLTVLVIQSVVYQVYVGGDAFAAWRIMSPTIPLVFILAIDGAVLTAQWLIRRSPSPSKVFSLASMLIVGASYSYNQPFLEQILFRQKPYNTVENAQHIKIALALRELTTKGATVGVVWAGTIPFYSERYAIDFLGKSDPNIAAMRPDLSGAIQWRNMHSVPGHNKYDLQKSIVNLKPTYIQVTKWGKDDVSDWVDQHYIRVRYKGAELLLLKNSSDVNWSANGLEIISSI